MNFFQYIVREFVILSIVREFACCFLYHFINSREIWVLFCNFVKSVFIFYFFVNSQEFGGVVL